MINYDWLNRDLEEGDIISNAPIAPTIIDSLLLPNEQFYEMCPQFNESQQHLFWKENWVSTQTIPDNCKWRCWHLRRCFMTTMIKHLEVWDIQTRSLRYPTHNLERVPVLVISSSGKAATGLNDIILHSAFQLPVHSRLNSYRYKNPSGKIFHVFSNKYQYLKVLIIDEISMIGKKPLDP